MADAQKDNDQPDEQDAATAPDTLGEAGLKALETERAKRKSAERELRELRPLAAKAAELEERDKTEMQRAIDRAEAAEKRAAALETDALRTRIGRDAGLPPEFASRLQGSTEEELAADAADLVKHLAPAGQPITTKPLASLSLGATTPDDQEPVDDEQAFRRLLSN
jgi:hypothetical protein